MLSTVLLAATGGDGWLTILYVIALALMIYGVYVIVARKAIGLGIFCIVLGLLIGPGGVSILS